MKKTPSATLTPEEELKRDLPVAMEHVRETGLAVDGGSNVGAWSRAMLELGFNSVWAFEPDPDNCTRTMDAIKEVYYLRGNNPAQHSHCYCLALMHKAGWASFNRRSHSSGYLTMGPGKVQMVTLDQLKLPRLDLLKLDVEGAELLALRGGERTVREFKPVIIVEVIPRQLARFGHSKLALEAHLAEAGARKVHDKYPNQVWTW